MVKLCRDGRRAGGRTGPRRVRGRRRVRVGRGRDEGGLLQPGRRAAGPAGHRVRVRGRRRGARLDGGVDRREPVARQAGRRHRDDGHAGSGRDRQLDARSRRRRRRVRPGQERRHPGGRRELRGDGHRRDGVVADQPVRPRHADRAGRRVHRRGAARREGALDRRPARAVDPGLRAVLRRERGAARAHARRRGAQHQGHGGDRAADRRRPADQAPGHRRHLGLQRRLGAGRVRRAHLRPQGGLRRGRGRRHRVRPERRRRRHRGDPRRPAHRDDRPGLGRHRLGADQGALRVRRGGQGRRSARRARRQERHLDAGEHRRLPAAARARATRSIRCRSSPGRRAEARRLAREATGCPTP